MGTTDAPCFSSLSPKRRGGALPRHVAAQLSSRPIPRGRCRTHPLLPPLLWRPSPGTEGRPDTARLRDPALAPRPHYKPRRREDYGQGKGPGSETPRWVERKLPAARGRCPASSVAALDAPAAGVKAPGQRAQHTHRHGHMARPEDGGDGSGQGQLRQAPETPWARRKGTSLFWTTEAGAPGQSARHGHRKSE